MLLWVELRSGDILGGLGGGGGGGEGEKEKWYFTIYFIKLLFWVNFREKGNYFLGCKTYLR